MSIAMYMMNPSGNISQRSPSFMVFLFYEISTMKFTSFFPHTENRLIQTTLETRHALINNKRVSPNNTTNNLFWSAATQQTRRVEALAEDKKLVIKLQFQSPSNTTNNLFWSAATLQTRRVEALAEDKKLVIKLQSPSNTTNNLFWSAATLQTRRVEALAEDKINYLTIPFIQTLYRSAFTPNIAVLNFFK